MKKLALILAILMLASCLFACSPGGPEVVSSFQTGERDEKEREEDEADGEDEEGIEGVEGPIAEPAEEPVFSDYPSDPHPSEAADYFQGNAASNLAGGGLVCKKEGVIYYVAGNMKKLCRMDEDGTNELVLYDITGEGNDQMLLRNINVFDGYVYFCMGPALYRIPLDGSGEIADVVIGMDDGVLEESIVCDEGIFVIYWDGRVSVSGGNVTFSDRMLIAGDKLDGRDAGPVDSVIPSDIMYDEGKLVFSVYGDNIRVMDIATGEIDIISNNVCNELICVQDGWVYYRRWNGSIREMYRVKLDGSDETTLGCDLPYLSAIHNDTVYFTGFANNSKLYSQVILDGTDLALGTQRLVYDAGVDIVFLGVIDGWIHFATTGKVTTGDHESVVYPVYRMRPDGTELEVLD